MPLGDVHVNTSYAKYTISNMHAPMKVDKAHNATNEMHVDDYAAEICEHWRSEELRYKPLHTYMTQQTEITDKMRAILMDWLVDVHLKFKLQPETLYLSASIVDRFLEQRKVTKQKLQLVGVVAMLLAAKYEEIYPPDIENFIYISANTYSRDEVLKWEKIVLATVEYNLTVPTVYNFLRRALLICGADKYVSNSAYMLAELAMIDYKMLLYLPSQIAAAALQLAYKLNGIEEWGTVQEAATQYRLHNFEACASDLYELTKNVPMSKQQAVNRKYSHTKFECASTILRNEHQPMDTA